MRGGRAFRQVDVFASGPFTGNPLAVVIDADDLTEAQMTRFARWTNLSETTFVLAPQTEGADYRVRIFTPGVELPFAGHPTLGTCHAWLEHTGIDDRETIVQECAAGLIEVRRQGGGLAFAGPPLLRSGPVSPGDLEEIVGDLGLSRDRVVDAAWADNGPGWVAVLLGSAAEVLAVRRPASSRFKIGVVGFHDDGLAAAIEVRAFFPDAGSVGEDPVTGSLNASIAQWLVDSGRITAPYVATQGSAIGRAGVVRVTQSDNGRLWIGGACATRVVGSVTIE